jgi:anti-sigma regulatory factor (Ser/Thr protein kinase)
MESIIKPTKDLIRFLKITDNTVDLSSMNFLYPIQILPLAAMISGKSLKFINPSNQDCTTYLKRFNFPDGLTEFITSEKFIPIYKFSASKTNTRSSEDKSGILDNLLKICLAKLGSPEGLVNALSLAIDEIISNIEDHSGAKFGWINAQYYPTKKYLDMCIVDTGITIKGKYDKVGMLFENDMEALKKALEGESSKPEKVRGSGLPTFTKIIAKGLQGEMVIISGNAIVYASKEHNPIVQKLSVRWNGTIVALRIPKNLAPIDYADYIE